jgi:hypothetical protein
MKKGNLFLILIILILSIPLISIIGVTVKSDEITPNDDFFTLSIGTVPTINGSTWNLDIDGLVDNPLVLNYENLSALPRKSVTATLKCVEGPAGRAVWTGVQLKTILDLAEVSDTAAEVVFYAADDFSSSLELKDATLDDVVLAYEMNGEVLPAEHGYPVRLVVPGKAGYKWVKWLVRIELVDYDYKGYWESRGWNDDAIIAIQSDWIIHASLLSVGFIFGGLSLVSGYKHASIGKLFDNLPAFLNKKFHRINSVIYLCILIGIFIFWAYTTYLNRGNLFYTPHGIISALVIIMLIFGGISGSQIKPDNKRMRAIHRNSTFFGFVLYAIVIITGLIIAYGT